MTFAQAQKQDAPAQPIEGKKTEKAEKRQAVTPDKKKAAEAPATGEGQAKSDTKEVKKSDKSKKRQAQTPDKKKAARKPPKAGPAAQAKVTPLHPDFAVSERGIVKAMPLFSV